MKSLAESIAHVCYEANRAYCASMGDHSFGPWEQAPAWQKSTNLAGVQMHLDNPKATPADSHESWLAVKKAEGWKYGAFKDVENKLHPCFVPYEELPPEQRAKDYIFRAIVHAIVKEQLDA